MGAFISLIKNTGIQMQGLGGARALWIFVFFLMPAFREAGKEMEQALRPLSSTDIPTPGTPRAQPSWHTEEQPSTMEGLWLFREVPESMLLLPPPSSAPSLSITPLALTVPLTPCSVLCLDLASILWPGGAGGGVSQCQRSHRPGRRN